MNSGHLVAAYGHMFPDLDIETGLLSRSDIKLVDANRFSDAELQGLGVEGFLLGPFKKLDAGTLERFPQCKGIVRYGIGVDNVDLRAAKERGIVVCNVPDYCIEEVALHALTFSLALMRGLPYWDKTIRAGEWRGKNAPKLRRPSTCTLGIIGFGQIGRCLEQRARSIFGQILVYDPWYKPRPDDILGPNTSVTAALDDLLAQADVVSVHVPLTPDTQGMLGERALRRLKPGSFVINVSRGGIIDEHALLGAVRDGHLGGAALDTFASEPLRADNELVGEPRILLTPHIAWISRDAEIELRRSAAEEIARILIGKPPVSPIKLPA